MLPLLSTKFRLNSRVKKKSLTPRLMSQNLSIANQERGVEKVFVKNDGKDFLPVDNTYNHVQNEIMQPMW